LVENKNPKESKPHRGGILITMKIKYRSYGAENLFENSVYQRIAPLGLQES